MIKNYIVNAAPALSLRPVRMRRWELAAPSVRSALSTCVRRIKKQAFRGETWRFTAHSEKDAMSRTVTY